jgi:hypothetical protein
MDAQMLKVNLGQIAAGIRPGIPTCATVFLATGVLLSSFFFFLHNIWFLSSTTYAHPGLIFGADTVEVVHAMRQVTFRDDMKKHLLFSATVAPLVSAFQHVPGISEDRSIALVLALLGALNIVGAFLLLRSLFLSTPMAALFSSLHAFFFSNLVIFSVPETYALSDLTILLYLSVLLKVRDSLNWRNCTVLSSLAGLASLYNPPLLSLMVIHIYLLWRQSKVRDWARLGAMNLAVGALIFLAANYLTQGWAFLSFLSAYSGRWGSALNLLDIRLFSDVLADFLFYSVSSPIRHLPAALGWQGISGYLDSWLGILLLPLQLTFICYAAYVSVSRSSQNRWLYVGLLAWIFLMILCYTYFNPGEAMLYSSQILLPLLIILVNAFETIRARAPYKYLAVSIFGGMLAINNYLALRAGAPGV